MPTDRKADRLERRVAQRHFDDPEVRGTLDELAIEELIADFGQPIRRTIHARPVTRPGPKAGWQPGDGRPDLADDDPATIQRIGMCLAARVRATLPVPPSLDASRIHPETCEWCDYPTEWLLAACEWATWSSRLVLVELAFWRKGEDGDDRWVTYERVVRENEYDNPRWAAWYDLTRQERARRLAQPSLRHRGAGVTAYRDFLAAKAALARPSGLDIDPGAVHPLLKPHQRDAVAWAVRGGRRAIFASFGLGKTLIQLETVRLTLAALGSGRGLIVVPLGVRAEFVRDAAMIGLDVRFIRDVAEASADGIHLTNYESVRDGKLDPTGFDVVSLDEAAILRGFGGTKTFRELMRLYEGTARYRFVATATPSPNEYIELLAYAAFLDVMDVGQAKTRFFRRDSEHADRLTLHPHKEEEFWLWCASWALFLQAPSDLGHSDEGYELPPLEVRWHELPTEGDGGFDRHGRGRLFANSSLGVSEAARERRRSLAERVERAVGLVPPGEQVVIWCDLNDEQRAIEKALDAAGITYSSLYGRQPIEERERLMDAWRSRETTVFLSKPSMYGAGVNLQQAHTMVFAGIGWKFSELIQGIHRIHRFLQASPCTVHLIHTEAEREVRAGLERKWRQHDELTARMGEIIRTYGLAREAMASALARSIGVERREVAGERYRLVNADAVEEVASMAPDSVDLIVTSIPFASQYEYTPSYNDFGHTESNEHFWAQMGFLTPELLRVLRPGRVAAIHVKDRTVPGGMTGLGFQTVNPFHAEAIEHYRAAGFAFLGMKTIVTDVVRENNRTYRLGWTEQCKDATRMGAGMPEYLLLFRRPPTDSSDGYANEPVVKPKAEYSRSRWQIDAHGFERSSGDRPLTPADLDGVDHDVIYRMWREHSLGRPYDFEEHVALGEGLEAKGRLPAGFMLLPPPSWHPDVWTDVARMRTLNLRQYQRGEQYHLCPLQFDIVDRLIAQYSMPGETVLDPFMGIGTVPYCAIRLGRHGVGIELSGQYFADAGHYVVAAAQEASAPRLFDLLDAETAA